MGDAIDRDEIKIRMKRIWGRTTQWKSGSFRAGFVTAMEYAVQAVDNCKSLEVTTVTRCGECRHATEKNCSMVYCLIHNRHKDPTDFCNFGDPDY